MKERVLGKASNSKTAILTKFGPIINKLFRIFTFLWKFCFYWKSFESLYNLGCTGHEMHTQDQEKRQHEAFNYKCTDSYVLISPTGSSKPACLICLKTQVTVNMVYYIKKELKTVERVTPYTFQLVYIIYWSRRALKSAFLFHRIFKPCLI